MEGDRPQSGDTVAAILTRLRRASGWSQNELAERAGLSLNGLSAIERGIRHRPHPRTLRALAAALGLSEDDRRRLLEAAAGSTDGQDTLGPLSGDAVTPHELPRAAADFVGRRDELRWLTELLVASDGWTPGASVVCAIDGMGGVGKSTLAIHAAHHLAWLGAFPDGQLYVNLRGATAGVLPLAPLEALRSLLRSLGQDPGAIPADVDEAARRYRSLTADRHLLLLLDNAPNADLVRHLLPGGRACAVLVTSRQPLTHLDGVHSLHLDVLSHDAALDLLDWIAGGRRVADEPVAAAEVVQHCGRLPLAIRIAGARLAARPAWPVRELAVRIDDATARLGALRAGSLAVRVCFDVSVRYLAESGDGVDRAALEAFELLGLVDGPDIGLPTAARLLDRPPLVAWAALERLVDARLLETPRPKRYCFHDLVRLYARERALERLAEPTWNAALTRAAELHVAAASRALGLLSPGRSGGTPPAGGDGIPASWADALRWLEDERANLLAALAQVTPRPDLASLAARFARVLGALLPALDHWLDLARVGDMTMDLARRTGDVALEATACAFLCNAALKLGRHADAVDLGQRGLDLHQRTGDPGGQAAILNAMAMVHETLGRHSRALAFYRRASALVEPSGNRRGVAVLLVSIGCILGKLGRYEEGIGSVRAGLNLARELGDRRTEVNGMNELAAVHVRLGLHAHAIRLASAALAVGRTLDLRYAACHSLLILGVAHGRLGCYETAMAELRKSAAISLELGHRRNHAVTLLHLAGVVRAAGNDGEARAALDEALAAGEPLGLPEIEEVRAGGRLDGVLSV
jgi:transcriptional regulator with XRE-family HTH domain/tetratricopeptide (TPR) repeat protein